MAGEVRAGYAFQGPALTIGPLLVGGVPDPGALVKVPLTMMNRHGLVAGATGTGKTVTLQMLAGQSPPSGRCCWPRCWD